MSEARRYSVAEIDAMREALRRRETAKVRPNAYFSGDSRGPIPSGSFNAEIERVSEDYRDAERRAEDHLRTYMLAGIDPGDLGIEEARE